MLLIPLSLILEFYGEIALSGGVIEDGGTMYRNVSECLAGFLAERFPGSLAASADLIGAKLTRSAFLWQGCKLPLGASAFVSLHELRALIPR
jgi:hypothetical protein